MVTTLLLTSLIGLFPGQEPTADSQRAMIFVRVPAGAKLFLDDFASTQTGEQRNFITPPLRADVTYYFTLRVEVMDQGQVVRRSKKIPVKAGGSIAVDFGTGLAAAEKSGDAPSAKKPKPDSVPAGFQMTREEQELIELTNKEREKKGLAPLRPHVKLAQAARAHSANMARQQKLDHVLDDKGPAERIREAGHKGFGWGENIAFGMPTPADAMRVWMSSEGHRGNILNEDYREIGVGIARDERGVPYYTQVFGR